MTNSRKKKYRTAFYSQVMACLALAVLGCTLAACGKKPGSVDPPPSVTEDHFPQLYPDPATDPKP